MARDDIDRRSLLRLGGVAAVSSLAGCGGQSSGALTEPTETRLSPREAVVPAVVDSWCHA
ncbi:hypothetical protein [Haloarchaeobius sp. FL176]|uniref:hypothetical protein n=1 Tax=Haloarchaeobius sp. FL176 TaxID=2967129 RepID=UPI0021479E12|nr:hypothetical protein [Haloarchaeobius sp. FL176]